MKPTKSAYVLNAFFRKILLNRKKKRKVQRFAATRRAGLLPQNLI